MESLLLIPLIFGNAILILGTFVGKHLFFRRMSRALIIAQISIAVIYLSSDMFSKLFYF
jgi:hypothetical protein